VKAADVDWFASASNYVQLHTVGHSHLIRMTMGDLEEKLDPTRFARIHRSTIVNIDRVKEVRAHEHEYVVILLEGTPLRMGRANRHRLLRGSLRNSPLPTPQLPSRIGGLGFVGNGSCVLASGIPAGRSLSRIPRRLSQTQLTVPGFGCRLPASSATC